MLPRLEQGHPALKEVLDARDRLLSFAKHEASPEVAEDIETVIREMQLCRLQALTLESVIHSVVKKIEVKA